MGKEPFSQTTMGRIGLLVKWFVLLMITSIICPMVCMASISTTAALLYLSVRGVYLFFEGMFLIIYHFTLRKPSSSDVGSPEFQQTMAKYEMFWMTDTPSPSPPQSDCGSDDPELDCSTLPSTIAYLEDANILPRRRWSTTAAPEPHPLTMRDSSTSPDRRDLTRRRIDIDTLRLAMRSTNDERERTRHIRNSDVPRGLTLPERRRRRLDLQRETIDRWCLRHQLRQLH
ncbi:uncharacterized protein B0H64DRAFT_406148 [Chaetomium fimeti]|uniref:Uncharacterized protein n=1 Tax=Chaetomium fimeti TaxID=1854472 RepID=A0AAE0H9Q1_9PEZI|nr:hypothetical protein B0H64DRAFT_406148 [Chaetomium fimeti]